MPNPTSWIFSPPHFSESFIVLHCTCMSVIHFELIFVYGVKLKFHFFGLWTSGYSGTVCWRDHLSSIELPLHCCQKSVGHMCLGLFLGSLLCSIDLCQSHPALITLLCMSWKCFLVWSLCQSHLVPQWHFGPLTSLHSPILMKHWINICSMGEGFIIFIFPWERAKTSFKNLLLRNFWFFISLPQDS